MGYNQHCHQHYKWAILIHKYTMSMGGPCGLKALPIQTQLIESVLVMSSSSIWITSDPILLIFNRQGSFLLICIYLTMLPSNCLNHIWPFHVSRRQCKKNMWGVSTWCIMANNSYNVFEYSREPRTFFTNLYALNTNWLWTGLWLVGL